MSAYYNEIDPKAAAVLRELIKAGHIAPGIVDERSIEDVVPAELMGYTQCHFFAGFGVWSYALRRAGWADSRPIWTGSCPCQPFSSAGKGTGFADQRHLWPSFLHLISECKPPIVAGEQVASKDADPWIDLVQADLEALDHSFGAVAFPSAGVGAPHIRDRCYWVAHAANQRQHWRRSGGQSHGGHSARIESQRLCDALRLANANSRKRNGITELRGPECDRADGRWSKGLCQPEPCGDICGLGNADSAKRSTCDFLAGGPSEGREGGVDAVLHGGDLGRTGPTNGLWRDADWLLCRDGKWRPVEPGTFPLAHGAPARVGRLRGYGNAINAEAAKAFIEAVMETDAASIGRSSDRKDGE